MFFDDYPAYPNTIGCRLNLSGTLDVPAMELAQKLAFQRNPMMNMTLDTKRRVPRWTQCAQNPVVSHLPDRFVDNHFLKKIDLDKEAGGQLHWAHANNRSCFNFFTHHASADGLGGLKVVSEFMHAYELISKAGMPLSPEQEAEISKKLGRVELQLLDRRGRYGFCSWRFFKSIPRQMIGFFGVKEFLANRPETLTTARHGPLDDKIPDDYPGFYSRNLEEINLLRERAGKDTVTANELILQCVFQATAKWRQKHGYGNDKDLIRIMVPINLRNISDRYRPASNRSSFVTLDRQQAKCQNEQQLLGSIRFQMNVVKGNELGYTFLHMLNFSTWLPRGVRRFTDPESVGSTLMVTNLGEPFRRTRLPKNEEGKLLLGDQVLESVELLAPLRPNTQAAFAVGRYAGHTFLTLTYDNRVLKAESARELVDMVCTEVRAKTGSK